MWEVAILWVEYQHWKIELTHSELLSKLYTDYCFTSLEPQKQKWSRSENHTMNWYNKLYQIKSA